MRGLLNAALTVALLVGGTAGLPELIDEQPATHFTRIAATAATQQETRERQCRFQWLDEGTWTPREERRTVACVLERWRVPGGLDFFVAVGWCESGWNRFASNGGRFLGLFQHMASSWSGRVVTYMPNRWRIGPYDRWTNSRTQIVVTARMVQAGGWGPWTCA